MKEQTFETILARCPELIEDGLAMKGRQVSMYGRRMDLLFEDAFHRKLIIELKVGPIKDQHIGQVTSPHYFSIERLPQGGSRKDGLSPRTSRRS
jgi:hypothetical protein